jgi:tetratricopeptide (TPR) repeat protein
MAQKKIVTGTDADDAIAKAQDFWTRYSKQITIGLAVVVLAVGGWYGYKNFVSKPNEEKAVDMMFKAEDYYRKDSIQKALNGDGINKGFAAVVKEYGSTDAGNLAKFYAGDCALRSGDFNGAVSYLKDFSTSAKQIQARAYKLIGDAYSELGKTEDAISNYKKAAGHFTEDLHNSAEYLLFAAVLADKSGKTNEAIELYKEIKEKFPNTQAYNESDKYLAMHNIYN